MLTIGEVLQDTMDRFKSGDDSRENLRDVLRLLRRQFPNVLEETLSEAVTTREAAASSGE